MKETKNKKAKRHTNSKKGISLIVLVITIIVMIILAATVIISLSNNGIIGKANEAVEQTNLKQVQTIATTIWLESKLTNDDPETVRDKIIAAIGGESVANKYNIEVTDTSVTVTLKDGEEETPGTGDDEESNVPVAWQAYVSEVTTEGVPIPKGFMVSPFSDEDQIAEGLVIYEIDGTETSNPSSENQHTWQMSKNQYVWIPVNKTTFGTTNTEFKRQNFGLSDTINTDAALGTEFWEVVPTTDETTDNNKKYLVTGETVPGQTLAEVQAMYDSVEEYGGFYIARYEAGISTQRQAKGTAANLPRGHANVHSKMGQIPYTYIPWTWNDVMNQEANGAVEVARSIYPNDSSNTTGVVSTLTYGVQWDTTLEWLRTNGKDINGNAITSVAGSKTYGNYKNHSIVAGDLNLDAKYWDYTNNSSGTYAPVTYTEAGVSNETKNDTTSWALSTGALKAAKVNNIYDMAGNMYEWTMEGYSTFSRVLRGGYFDVKGSSSGSLAKRYYCHPYNADDNFSFRPSLYIKK